MRTQQIARRAKERVAVRGKTHDARRALHQLLAEVRLQPLEPAGLTADCVVSSASAARVTVLVQIGDQHEGVYRIEIEDFHFD